MISESNQTLIPAVNLNASAHNRCKDVVSQASRLRVALSEIAGSQILDFGVKASGGIDAGLALAEISLAGLGDVSLVPSTYATGWNGPGVMVKTDHPVAACMASQYAGWQVTVDDFFGMGSGPMRAAAAREDLFTEFGYSEKSPSNCVGVLESSELPSEAACQEVAEKCGIEPSQLTLLVAPTNSQAGAVQVVARSIETALHKLHELGFDLMRVESGWGTAPLPPVAGDALGGIGRTNDAVLYGGHAVLYIRGDDDTIAAIGPKTPSSASDDHGRPFKEIFAAYDHDFYKIDKHLFSPAMITFVNLDTGRTQQFGEYTPGVIAKSFGIGL